MQSRRYLIKTAIMAALQEDQLTDPEERKKELYKTLAGGAGVAGISAIEPLSLWMNKQIEKNPTPISREEVEAARKAMGIKSQVSFPTDLPAVLIPIGKNKYIHDARWVITDPDRSTALHEMGHAQDLEKAKDWRRIMNSRSHLLGRLGGVTGGILAGGADPQKPMGTAILRSLVGGTLGGVAGGLPKLYTEGKATWFGAQQAGKMFGSGARTQMLKEMMPAFGSYLGRQMAIGAGTGVMSSIIIRKIRLALLLRKKEKDERERQLSGQ